MSKRYRLYCEYCGYNRYSDGKDIGDLTPYKRSSIQTGLPKYESKKVKTKDFYNLPKMFKCPTCGRLITPRKIQVQDEKIDNARDQDGNA